MNQFSIKFIVNLINMGSRIYDGYDEQQAYFIAERSGFECSLVVLYCGEIVATNTYSPIGGWKVAN